MVPPPIQTRHRKSITYGRISHSNSANFKVFQDMVEGSSRNGEPRATVPRRTRASGLLPPSLPPMAEQSLLRSEFDSIYHISDDNNEDPFADPPALSPQISTGLSYTKDVKQSVGPSLSRKIALAEKTVNHPILRNTIIAMTDTTSPSGIGHAGGPPPRPHKIRHYEPSLEDQDFPYILSPSKARSPISKGNFRRFSNRAAEKEVSRPYNTPPTGSGIDRQGMADGNTRAGTWVRDKARYVVSGTKKTAEKMMGSSPPSARYKSHDEKVTPTPLKKTIGGGVRKALSPQYSVERMKKRRKGYEPVPTTTDCETGHESDGDSSVKDPFASGQDDDFEHGIFAGESSDYIAEIPKKRRNVQELYGCDNRAQSTQNLLAETKEMDPSTKKASTKNKSRKLKYDVELEDRSLGEDWDERESSIAGVADSLMAYMSGSNEGVSPASIAQPTPKRQSWGQLRTRSKIKSKIRAGKPPSLENKRNSRSKSLGSDEDTDTDPTVGSSTEGLTVGAAQEKHQSIPAVYTANHIKRHDVKNDELVRNKKLKEEDLGYLDSLRACNPSPDTLSARANSQYATYPDSSKTVGKLEDVGQNGSIPNGGIDMDTRGSTLLDTKHIQGDRQGKKAQPNDSFEDSTFQGPIRTSRSSSKNVAGDKQIGSHSHGVIPLNEKPQKSMSHNTKRKKDVKKTKTSKPKAKMVCEDDYFDELQMDLPGMRI
ncbi:hypothetical protein L873DRAFT_1781417 [Choiromyces venosus 120613-1]|uniref:Uncharacterized protein n=1 Tax=Choiromyces venosus 120613-1 TaxID=1336337 RepID=A0A3N4J3W3_9PEZI|nr:hypothetical protein L873DRAFT_1781417 [Choiromyces venosus 120613-1]